MPQSLVCLPVHFVFSTKGREPWVRGEWADRLYAYAGGIVHTEKCQLLAAGGMPDHVHLLVSVGRTIALADLMRLVTKGLNRNERLIIILYYYEELTMKEIGATLDLSESRVSQMHSSIVQRLQNQLLRRRPEFGT